MPHIDSNRRKHVAAVLVFVLAGFVLAACGSSSKSSSTAGTGTSASSTSPFLGGAAGAAGRFAVVRACLQKNGITLPRPGAGSHPPVGGFLGSTAALPKGMTRAQYDAIIRKCGDGFRPGTFAHGFNAPAAKQALAKFAACMRENGVNVPTPNTSGKGPIFNSKGLDTTSAKFAAAEVKCRADLRGALLAHPGGAAAPGEPAPTG